MSDEEVATPATGSPSPSTPHYPGKTLAAPSGGEELIWQSAFQLARCIAAGEASAAEVVEAHICRIEEVNPRLNALVIRLFAEARSAAAEADRRRSRGESLGPLHGVPVTVKECYHVAGTTSCIGVDGFRNEVISVDGPLVRRLRRAGAILLGKTNVPQAMLLHETDNPIYGRTSNPWDLARSPGGSSGGEASLIAAGGSPLGLANDLGGSIRQPAHVCGICGIKPSPGRLTNTGCRNNLSGLKLIATQSGALARHTEDLYLALRVLSDRAPEEPGYEDEFGPSLSDPATVDLSRLRIGIFDDDGFFTASPAVRRAVRESGDALRLLGCKVVPFQPPKVHEAMSLYFALIGADGGRALHAVLDGARVDWRIARLMQIGRIEQPWRALLGTLSSALGQPRMAMMLRSTGRKTDSQMVELSRALAAQTEYFLNALDTAAIDALVFPPHALVAPPHGATIDLPPAGSYCFLANLFGLPAGTVSVTCVRPGEESDRAASLQLVERAAHRVEKRSAGLPVGVQIAAKPWREDIVLALMQAIEQRTIDAPRRPLPRAAKPFAV